MKTQNTYAVDFETYYDKDYSLESMGTEEYLNDPRLHVYLVAIAGPEIRFYGHPEAFDWQLLTGQHLVAHNARFDQSVYERLVELGKIPEVNPASWDCTADLAVYLRCGRSLLNASRSLLGVKLDKSTRAELEGVDPNDLEGELRDKALTYVMQDADCCLQIWEQYNEQWPESEKILSRLNRELGRRGVQIDVPLLTSSLTKLKQVIFEANKLIPWEWGPGTKRKTPLAPTQIMQECRKAGISCPGSFAQDSDECREWEDRHGNTHLWIGALRDWRRANILLKRLETVEKRLTPEGIFPFSLLYFGAHTGRYSGTGGYNMQNMLKNPAFGVNLRHHFIARPGHKLVIADLSQIEARITLWIAGDYNTLDKIEAGLSIYEAHAIQSMGWEEEFGKLKETNPELYLLAKARVLSLGFGCGWLKFITMAAKCGLVITPDVSKETVDNFRSTNPKITDLWRMFERDCIRSRGENYSLTLPSGREFTYFNILTANGLEGEIIRDVRKVALYGGRITENVVQATARDLYVEHMLTLKDAGIQHLFGSHDEYVMELPEGNLQLDTIEEIISVTPDWLEGCPIGCEITVTDHYLKD